MKRNNTFLIIPFAVLVSFAFLTNCMPPDAPVGPPATNSANTSITNVVNTNGNLANSNGSGTSTLNSVPITMPLIDSMFLDEEFLKEARAIGLSDEELTKLRDAARNEVLQMDGGPGGDQQRSTRSTVEKTKKKIEEIVGQQKADQFLELVRRRWVGEGTDLEIAGPNSVPKDTRIVVNSPAYRMDLFKDGQLVKTYKIGIGYPEFPLPTGLRRAAEIIFNPEWTPPDEPWVKGKYRPYEKVEAGSKLNPLGVIKIPIGLPSLIHGGKDASRLGTFASHGCVGLTNAMVQDFAVQLGQLSGTAITSQDIKKFEKAKTETKNVKLAEPVPVELRYETIVVEDGKLHIYRDVYERGTNTEEDLKRVLAAYDVAFDKLSETDKAALRDALAQMGVDAQGKTIPEAGNANAANSSKAKQGKVTRNIKGKKEIIIELAELKGKGYPSAVASVGR
jgi:lipoprotein-anchoring transpeptidase ErfK/SrfK